MKKLSRIFIFLLTLIFLFGFAYVNASNSDNDLLGYKEISSTDVTTLSCGVEILSKRIDTIHNGVGNTINHHTVNYAIGNMNKGIKVVAAGSTYDHSWTAVTTRQAMIDYEKKNPGFICIAGINADGFDIDHTFQPYRHFMTDGDLLRPEGGGYLLGFNDTTEIIHGATTTISDHIYLKKYNDDKKTIKEEVEIAVVNNNPSKQGISLYTTGNDSKVDLTGFTVYDCKYEISRVAFEKEHVFVKGTVDNVIEGTTDMIPLTRHFYLASCDGSVEKAIKPGDYIKCEYNLTDGYKRATNILGVTHQLFTENGEVRFKGSEKPFENTNHPRSIIGLRSNGDMILATIDGRGESDKYLDGASFYECGQILKAMGCYQGYTFDGGGSTTLVARMSDGEFKVLNTPSDGRERACGNHLLFVMKDPGFSVKCKEKTHNSLKLTFNITNDVEYKKASNIKFNFDGKEYNIENKDLIIDNLKEKTPYEAILTYDVYDEGLKKTINKVLKLQFTTGELKLEGYPFKMFTGGSFIKFTKLDNNLLSNIKISIKELDNKEFDLNDELVINNLTKDTIYTINYKYTITDGKTTHDYNNSFTVLTKNVDLPHDLNLIVKKQTKNTTTIAFSFNDPDFVVLNCYIEINGNWYKDIITNEGINSYVEKINNSIFNKDKDNEVKVVLEYLNGSKTLKLEFNPLNVSLNTNNNIIIPIVVGVSVSLVLVLGVVIFIIKKRRSR